MSFIAIDLGTSFIKGAILNLETLSIGHIQRLPCPDPVPGLPALFFEVDPAQLVQSFVTLVAQLLPHAPDCQGIVMCSQMHGLILATPDGQARTNCITWQDQRALQPHPSGIGSFYDAVADRLNDADKRQIGQELKPSLPLCSLFWLVETGRIPNEPLIPTSLPDFILANLTRSTPTTELTNAGAHGALNLESSSWHQGVIDPLGLAQLRWPEIHPLGGVAAQIEIGSTTLPCYTPIGDHQAAVLGTLLGPDELALNIGTASQVTMLTQTLQLGDYQTRPYVDGRFMNTISRLPAGRSLSALVKLLTELATASQIDLPDPWRTIAAAVAEIETTDLAVDLSFFANTMGDRGQIANIREDNLTVGHLFKAAFQNMADNYVTCSRRLAPDQPWQRLVFAGGVAQKLAPLRQVIRHRFRLETRMSASTEDTLLGLMALALVVSGMANSIAAASARLLEHFDNGD